MQCQRCQFENMPGLQRCMRCGTILGAPAGQISIFPPRMSRWKKPFRDLFRFFRLGGLRLPKLPSAPKWAQKFLVDGLITSIFSIIPGLVQLLTRQFRTIFWYWAAWIVLMAMSIFLWSSGFGIVCFGLTLAVHVWIAMKAGILREFIEFRERIVAFLILAVVYYFIYYFGSLYLLRIFSIQSGYSLVDASPVKVQIGDYLIGRSRNFTPGRGDLVYTRLREVGGYRGGVESSGFVRIIGLPGEKLEITDNVFIINGKPLDTKQYPVPGWLVGVQKYSVKLSSEQYFVIGEFSRRGGANIGGLISSACVFSIDDFQAKAFLRWWPLRTRGFIENNP